MVKNPLTRFLDANRRASRALESIVPIARQGQYAGFDTRVRAEIVRREHPIVLDVGGGKRLSFDRPDHQHTVIALDISPAELIQNDAADHRIAADACSPLPLPDQSVDVLVSRTVMEHLPRVDAFLREARRVLRPGGVMVHYFPAKWAVFSVLNRLVPHALARRVLFALRPDVRHSSGFPAYYQHCAYGAMRRELKAAGVVSLELSATYYSSRYYEWCTPLYALSVAYESVLAALDLKGLASYLLVVGMPATTAGEAP